MARTNSDTSKAGNVERLRLEKYAANGELQFTPRDVWRVASIPQHGNVAEIIGISTAQTNSSMP